jgi:hypothetical protein
MRRIARKPGFWVTLIIASFAVNLLAAWVTVNQHLHIHSSNHVLMAPHPFGGFTQNTNIDQPVSESVLWHRMLQEQPGCEVPIIPAIQNETQLLPAFGFRQHVQRFLESDPSIQTCLLPPLTSCFVTKYSVVVLSKGTNLRILFLNLMTFISYPSVQDITLILPQESKAILAKDSKYGQRLLEWNKQRTVKLIIHEQSLWAAMQMVQPQSEAVIWMNGDVHKDWNGTRLKNYLGLWSDRSRSLISSSQVVQKLRGSSCSFPQLHGLVLHRNLLCYLDHPVVGPLRQYAEPLGWDITQNAIGVLWNHIGDGHSVAAPRSDRLRSTATTGKRRVAEISTNTILNYFGCSCESKSTITSTLLSSSNTTTC